MLIWYRVTGLQGGANQKSPSKTTVIWMRLRFMSDLGLLCAKKDLAANDILYMVEEINDFKGGMAENYVNVQLTINGYHTYYWESERGAEIDFIIQRDGQLIPH